MLMERLGQVGVSNVLLLMVVICHKMITKHMCLLQNQQETMRLNLRCANISVRTRVYIVVNPGRKYASISKYVLDS